MKKYDAVIIGTGKGGKALAGDLSGRGMSVAVVERDAEMFGGTCVNVGCMPTKSLVNSAEIAALFADAPWADKAQRYADAIHEKQSVTVRLRGNNLRRIQGLSHASVFMGAGSFLSPHRVLVRGVEGESELEAERIFINTGSSPVVPDIPGLAGNPLAYTSERLMNEDRLPQRLVLIGAGYIGLEFASMYAAFGAQVTVLEAQEQFLPREDEDIALAVRAILEKRGVTFHLGAQVQRVEGGRVTFAHNGQEQSVEADAILLSAGRRPNTEQLNAAAAGVALTPRGAVQVDEHLRTTADNIWAMGDVAGGWQFTYVSLDDYRIVASQLFGDGARTTADRVIPFSVFMDTPLSRVGLTEREARQQGLPIRVLTIPAAMIPKTQLIHKTDGMLKAVVHAETGKILGASLLCYASYEVINTIKLAMDLGAPYWLLRDRIYTHPTMSEGLNDLFAQ